MKFIILLLTVIHFQTFAINSTSKSNEFCGVIGMYVVSPEGELEQFLFAGPPQCYNKNLKVNISKDWLVTACAYFTLQQNKPTYGNGEKLKWNSKIFYYLPTKPNVVYPKLDAGSGLDNPVVYVQGETLGSDHKFCDGILHKT